jgi:hypothetical protein
MVGTLRDLIERALAVVNQIKGMRAAETAGNTPSATSKAAAKKKGPKSQ